jgi:uncharacterized membrane protein
MTLAPLLAAPLWVQVHAFAALAGLVLGSVQLAAPKGRLPHRRLGWLWVMLLATVAASSFFIHTICSFGAFSAIHLLSLATLALLPLAVLHARRHRVKRHSRAMVLLFSGALVLAGFFTLSPGRIMHDVLFGTASAHGSCG